MRQNRAMLVMDFQHINIKIYVDGDLSVDVAQFIDIFHEWIRTEALDEMLIDVADYRHVPAGPSVLLIGLEADYGMDNADHRYGLMYNRKAPLDGSNEERFCHALRAAVHVCQMLEAKFGDNGSLKFHRQEFDFLINDRAIAPNTPETFNACKSELEASLQKVLGHSDFSLEHNDDPRKRFCVKIKVAKPIDFSALLST